MKFGVANHRAIVITEGGTQIFRHDNPQSTTLEAELVNAISRLSDDKRLNVKKFYTLLRASLNKFSIIDVIDILREPESYRDLLGENTLPEESEHPESSYRDLAAVSPEE